MQHEVLSVLDKSDVVSILAEATAADVEAVLADQAAHSTADTTADTRREMSPR